MGATLQLFERGGSGCLVLSFSCKRGPQCCGRMAKCTVSLCFLGEMGRFLTEAGVKGSVLLEQDFDGRMEGSWESRGP